MSEIEKKWYVLRAVSGKESKVKEYLDADIKNSDLSEYVSQVLIPTEKVYQVRNVCLRHHRHIGITTHYNANLRAILCICHNVLLMCRFSPIFPYIYKCTKILSMMQWFYESSCNGSFSSSVPGRTNLPF